MSRIGSEINRIRKEKGLTQKQLGKLVGVSESYIIDVETGKKVLSDDLAGRIYRILGREVNGHELYADESNPGDNETGRKVVKAEPKPVQQIWNDALGGVLKTIPVYDYRMDKAIDTKQLPIVSNKIEGYPKDKVFYLKIEDGDMTGFRIAKGDLALAYTTQEIERDAIFLIEYNEKRAVRQIKRLDGDKLLLVSNRGSLITETASVKSIKVLGRLVRLEIAL